MDKRIATIIGMNLQRLRTQYGLTQEQLAEKVGISTSFYANLERRNKGVSISVLPRAHCFDHFAVSDIHADMPVVPDGKTGCFGDGIDGAGGGRGMVHLVC